MPVTSPSVSSSIFVIAKPSRTGPKLTVATVWMRVGGWPAPVKAAETAIEKHAAWAAAISSSGFVPVPSSKRDLYEYCPSKAPLPSFRLPAPDFRSPRHSASEIRFAISDLDSLGGPGCCCGAGDSGSGDVDRRDSFHRRSHDRVKS